MADFSDAVNIGDLRECARRRLPRAIFDFFDGGAEDEVALRDNRAAYERVRLAPRVLRDVSKIDMTCEILGGPSQLPLVIAPTGGIGIGWPGADVAIARAAAHFGIPYTLSTTSTATIEAVAEANGDGRRWFQLYILYDRAFTDKLVERARVAGYEALVVTVDLPVGGKRERDSYNRFVQPYRPRAGQVLEAMTKPGWALRVLANGGLPTLENLRGFNHKKSDTLVSISSAVGQNLDSSFDYAGLQRLRDLWKGKLVVKGVARADDAERIVGVGADCIWISNHGGRQLDAALATLDTLPSVVAAVGGKVPVILDGGVRRGVDMIKARALGAQAVCAGRPTLYGASAGGEPGARRALAILADELHRGMQLCGAPAIADIDRNLVAGA
ncbi:MAG: alpha-hydroxy acid oxidase [Betaproteobacteria bacterium]